MKKSLAILVAAIALAVWTVPAMADVKFGGQYRLRAEARSATSFNGSAAAASDDQSFYGQRVRLWGTTNPTSDTTIKLTIQDTQTWGDGTLAAGPDLTDTDDDMDLHESYLEVKDFFGTPVTLKVGRQELVYGDERLVGAFNWSNNARSFDALKVSLPVADVGSLDVWTAKVSDAVDAGDADNDVDFYGVYFTTKAIPDNTLDLYVLWNRDGAETDGDGEIDRDIKTYGLRLAGAAVGIDYTAELPFQTGEVMCVGPDVCDVDANAFAVKLGYAIPGGPMGLKVGLEYDFASGQSPTGTDVETFYNLYPTNHDKYGTMDQQAWRNMNAWNINASIKPNAKLTARLDFWDFSLDEETDGWYGAGTWNAAEVGALRAACPACVDDEVGQEIDITLNYKYNDALGIMGGVSQFMTGDAIEERVALDDEEDSTWAFVQLTANF